MPKFILPQVRRVLYHHLFLSQQSTSLLHPHCPLPPLISLVALLQTFPLEVNHKDQEKLNITNKETESQNLCQRADTHQEDSWVIHKRDQEQDESLSQLHILIHNFTIEENGDMSPLTNQRKRKKKARKGNT